MAEKELIDLQRREAEGRTKEKMHEISSVVVEIAEGILFLKRAGKEKEDIEAEMYNLPSGHIEGEETPMDAAIRETAEESGIALEAEKVHYITDVYVDVRRTDGSGLVPLHVYLFFAKRQDISLGDVKLCGEHSVAVAISIEELKVLRDCDSKGVINLSNTFTLFDTKVIKDHIEDIARISIGAEQRMLA